VLALLATLVALVLIPSAGARSPSPCALLTNHEVATAFSSVVVGHNPGGVGLSGSCTWLGTPLTNGYGQPSVQVTVFRIPEVHFLQAERRSNGQSIHGIGTAANWIERIAQLSTWYRGYEIDITVRGPRVSAPLIAEKTLAGAALARL
jgi:hypothetical protein